jgi:hypothetical protein
MMRILTTILDQDFFFNNKIYQQKEGLHMGASLSPIHSEIYIQNINTILLLQYIIKLQNPWVLQICG